MCVCVFVQLSDRFLPVRLLHGHLKIIQHCVFFDNARYCQEKKNTTHSTRQELPARPKITAAINA